MGRIPKPLIVALGVAAVAAGASLSAEFMDLKLRDSQIFVETKRLNLIRGAPLARLKNGASVAYDFHLSLWVGSKATVRRRTFERFVVSYDLWEEKFAVAKLRMPRATAAGLTPLGIETWCLDRVGLPADSLVKRDKIWVRLEVRAVDPKQDSDLIDSGAITVANLIEMLSRPARKDEHRWSMESGPIELAQIREEAKP